MAGLLDTRCSLSRAELEGRKKIVPFGEIFEKASEKKNIPLPFSKSILEKSGKNGISVIAELKRSSPSEGLIRENFVPDKIALSLEKSGAAALSVLTEKKFFGGNIEVLEKVSGTVKIPTLRKDFIFDEYQLCEARLAGASAALLIARILDPKTVERFIEFAGKLSLETLCEAHTSDEAKMLCDCGARIIGVNCRNLETLKVDFSSAGKILESIPDGVLKVHESGVSGSEDLKMARDSGASAVLVGTRLMRAENPGEELSALLGGLI